MVHKDPSDSAAKPEIKQVEFNTIASSFGGLATKVSSLHQYVSVLELRFLVDGLLDTCSQFLHIRARNLLLYGSTRYLRIQVFGHCHEDLQPRISTMDSQD